MLCSRAASRRDDPGLHAEMEDLLAEGYLRALEADHLTTVLRRRRDALIDGAEDIRAIASEERSAREAAHRLRLRLAVMREHWLTQRVSA